MFKDKFDMVASTIPELDIIVFDGSDDQYMLAADVLDVFGTDFGSKYVAKQVIGAALRAGEIECFAEEYWQTDRGDVAFDPWRPTTGAVGYAQDVILPPELFRSSQQWPEDFSLWKWDSSEFVLFLTEDEPGERIQRAHLAGARLLVAAVEALIKSDQPSDRGGKSRIGVGGRPIRTEAWTAFWHVLLKLAVEQQLADFDTQKDLRHAILLEIGDALSEETITEPVRKVWKKFVKKQDYT